MTTQTDTETPARARYALAHAWDVQVGDQVRVRYTREFYSGGRDHTGEREASGTVTSIDQHQWHLAGRSAYIIDTDTVIDVQILVTERRALEMDVQRFEDEVERHRGALTLAETDLEQARDKLAALTD